MDHVHAMDAVACKVYMVALKAEFELMTDILEPSEKCMVCFVEFRQRKVVERKPCGHTYHEDCLECYIKHNVDCPTCYYDEPESSSKSSSGARSFASEEDIIKVSCDFPNIDDDESEEETSDEPREMCMVCLVEFDPREVVERKPGGHTCHEDSTEYYIKHNMDCPTCYYDDPASSSKFSSGAREFAAEEDFIKMFSSFLYTNDDESEEESFNEPGEMCMMCLVEFQPREAVERKPCGHAYHEDCRDYYIEHDIECPMCHIDISL